MGIGGVGYLGARILDLGLDSGDSGFLVVLTGVVGGALHMVSMVARAGQRWRRYGRGGGGLGAEWLGLRGLGGKVGPGGGWFRGKEDFMGFRRFDGTAYRLPTAANSYGLQWVVPEIDEFGIFFYFFSFHLSFYSESPGLCL